MDSSAIQRIEELARASTDITVATDIPAVVIPSGCKIESLESLLERPTRMRKTYTTERLEDFCRYVKAEADEATAVFVAPDGAGAKGVIDYGSHAVPGWADHKAQLAMKHTREFAGLQAACAKQMTQRDLIDWLEDWGNIIKPVIDGEEAALSKALATIRRVEIKATASKEHTDGDFKASRSSMEQVEAASKDGQLPEAFLVTCQVYPCTKQREVGARLSLLTGADKPTFRLRIMGLDSLLKEVAEEIEMEIATRLSGTRTFIGSV